LLSVADASQRLGVDPSRVRQLVRSGELRASRVGRQWLLDADAVDERARRRPSHRGRPLAPRSAWGLLVRAAGQEPDWLDRVERSRIRRRLRNLAANPDVDLRALLRSRADVHHFYAHPAAIPRLLAEPGVIRSGASAVSEVGADLIAADVAEAYVSGKRLDQLIRRYRLRPADHPNLILRVPRTVWPFSPHQMVAPVPVVAADLLDADDDRSQRAGRQLFADVLGSGPA
jgi:excisionase family DNA binding protein